MRIFPNISGNSCAVGGSRCARSAARWDTKGFRMMPSSRCSTSCRGLPFSPVMMVSIGESLQQLGSVLIAQGVHDLAQLFLRRHSCPPRQSPGSRVRVPALSTDSSILSAFYTSAPTHGRRRPWHRSARGLACDPRGEARGEIRGRSVSALAQASPQLAQREAETGDNVAAVNYLLTDVPSPGFSQVRPPVRAAGRRAANVRRIARRAGVST